MRLSKVRSSFLALKYGVHCEDFLETQITESVFKHMCQISSKQDEKLQKIWQTFTASQRRRIEAAEMKLLRPLAGYTLYHHKTNNSIRKELRTTSILDKIDEQRKRWLLHIQRKPQNRIPLKSYNYRPQGRRSIGRPKKRWREQL